MPIYEYKCSACSHELESLQKFSDAPLVTCPACGKDALTKLVSAAGFQLKGSGWYQTDFRGGGKPPVKAGAPKSESGASTSGGGEGGKEGGKDSSAGDGAKTTESKPAAPTTSTATSGGTPSAGA